MTLLLLDTHLLIWGAENPDRLPRAARVRIEDARAAQAFSVASIWEVAIKVARGRGDFAVDAGALRGTLLRSAMREFAITGAHALEAGGLPPLHKDPFDRLLVAQARVERAVLLTADAALAQYGAPVELVG